MNTSYEATFTVLQEVVGHVTSKHHLPSDVLSNAPRYRPKRNYTIRRAAACANTANNVYHNRPRGRLTQRRLPQHSVQIALVLSTLNSIMILAETGQLL